MKFKFSQIALILVLALVVILLLLPVWFALVTSCMASVESLKGGLHFWPENFSIKGYEVLFTTGDYLRPLINSTIVTVFGTFFHVLLCALAAYTLIQKNIPWLKFMMALLLITMAVPQQVLIIPTYLLYKHLAMINTYTALIVYGLVSGFSILLLHSYFKSIPYDLTESARIDGASELQIFWKIYLPMGKSGLITVMVINAVMRWNDFTSALLFITDPNLYTVQLALKTLVGSTEQASSNILITPNVQMAAVVIGLLPLVILYFIAQKYIVKGTSLGALKE